ncbi:8041_t:CDS:2 [Entrophospora sp. SA101]|nr:8041_t:CDS:2 [Entrophospora sp. SA101]
MAKNMKKFQLKHAIKFTAKAWKSLLKSLSRIKLIINLKLKVTSQTIVNCWKKTGILPDYDINSNEIENMSSILNLLNVRELNDLQNLIDELCTS